MSLSTELNDQLKELNTKLTDIRNEFSSSLPTGEIKAWDLIKRIQTHLAKLDEFIDTELS